jgi:hypothetical protein
MLRTLWKIPHRSEGMKAGGAVRAASLVVAAYLMRGRDF